MKQTILTLLLTCMQVSAMAEWVHVWGNNVLDAYVEPDSVRMKSNRVLIQNMFDFRKPTEYLGNEFRSMVNVYEYDCKKERMRALESVWYADNKGEGAIVDSSSLIYEWHRAIPATPGYVIMQYACEHACGENKLKNNVCALEQSAL